MKKLFRYTAEAGWLAAFLFCVALIVLSIVHVEQLGKAQTETIVFKGKFEIATERNEKHLQILRKEIGAVNHNIVEIKNDVVSIEDKIQRLIKEKELYLQVEQALKVKR